MDTPSSGLRILNYLTEDRILLLRGRLEKNDVLDKLIDILAKIPDIGTRDDLAWGIFHRESLMSTGIGNGIATPHFRLQSVSDSYLALAVCQEGVADYAALDSKPVRLVFLIVAGKDEKSFHVRILAEISRLFSDGRLKAACLAASDPKTCMEIISRAQE